MREILFSFSQHTTHTQSATVSVKHQGMKAWNLNLNPIFTHTKNKRRCIVGLLLLKLLKRAKAIQRATEAADFVRRRFTLPQLLHIVPGEFLPRPNRPGREEAYFGAHVSSEDLPCAQVGRARMVHEASHVPDPLSVQREHALPPAPEKGKEKESVRKERKKEKMNPSMQQSEVAESACVVSM